MSGYRTRIHNQSSVEQGEGHLLSRKKMNGQRRLRDQAWPRSVDRTLHFLIKHPWCSRQCHGCVPQEGKVRRSYRVCTSFHFCHFKLILSPTGLHPKQFSQRQNGNSSILPPSLGGQLEFFHFSTYLFISHDSNDVQTSFTQVTMHSFDKLSSILSSTLNFPTKCMLEDNAHRCFQNKTTLNFWWM